MELLLVHPLSVSGRAAPAEALRRARIEPTAEQVRFTYSHSQSIRMLSEPPPGRERVAFVWDDAAGHDLQLETGVRRMPFPELDELVIPHDVVVVRTGFEHAVRLQTLLLENVHTAQRYRFKRIDDWRARYRSVRDWLDAADAEQIELVDGGFAHNSPVEAAVLWGATHIVLIEATPRKRSERGNFLKNVASSFRHLHRQAQLLDARSRGKVIVFSLSPEPPHMCVLDFADNLIAASIARGYRDASLAAASNDLRFRKELGEPIFVEARPAIGQPH